VDVDAFADEYSELEFVLVPDSTKLVVDWVTIMRFSACELWMPMPILPGDGRVWALPSGRELSILIVLGLEEKSFILLLPSFDFCSWGISGIDVGLGEAWDCCCGCGCGCCCCCSRTLSPPGEPNPPLGNTAFAALVAAILAPPTRPFEYVIPFVLKVTGGSGGGGLFGTVRAV